MLFEVIDGNKNSQENGYFTIYLKRIWISKFWDKVPSILILSTIQSLFEWIWNTIVNFIANQKTKKCEKISCHNYEKPNANFTNKNPNSIL